MQRVKIEKNELNEKDVAWNKCIDDFLGNIDRNLLSHGESHLVIKSIKRRGCDLSIEFLFDEIDEEKWNFWTAYFYGTAFVLKKHLLNICAKCGKDKGTPPSTTVRPGLCESCRNALTPDDFKNTVAIGMIGKAGSGKDTIADYFVSKHNFIRMALADPIRDIIQLLLVCDRDSIWDRKLRELPIDYLDKMKDGTPWTGRKLLQFTGTELFRDQVDRKIWVRNLAQRMEPGNNYVISDCRFPNEVDILKKEFGGRSLLIEVIREGCDGKGVGISGHESEKHKLEADIVIENNGTLEQLYEKIEDAVQKYRLI